MSTLAVPPTPSRQSSSSARSFVTARSGSSTLVESKDVDRPAPLSRQRSSSVHVDNTRMKEGQEDKRETEGRGQRKSEDNIVRFEENDEACPRNWTERRKWKNATVLLLADLATGMASTGYSPASTIYGEEARISEVAAQLPLVLYAIGFGIGPLMLGPLSEWGGRKYVYLGGHTLQASPTLFAVGAALAPNPGGLFVLRFLGGIFGAMTITNLGASFADMWDPQHTGPAMALFVLSDIIGPALGYSACAPAAQFSGWRTTLWMVVGFCGITLIFLFLFVEETRHSIILEKRMLKKRKETGNSELNIPEDMQRDGWKQLVKQDIVRPIVFQCTEAIIIAVAIIQLQLVGLEYLFTTSYNLVFGEESERGFSNWQVGLIWFGLIVGACVGLLTYSVEERHFRRAAAANGGVIVPEARIGPFTCIAGIVYPASLFWFAWTSAPSIHWIVPTLATAFFGWAFFTLVFAFQAYITDGYGSFASSGLAGADLLRSSGGGCFPLFGAAMYRSLGNAKASTVLAGLGVLATPLPFVFRAYGHRLRHHSPYARQHMAELEEEKGKGGEASEGLFSWCRDRRSASGEAIES